MSVLVYKVVNFLNKNHLLVSASEKFTLRKEISTSVFSLLDRFFTSDFPCPVASEMLHNIFLREENQFIMHSKIKLALLQINLAQMVALGCKY